METWGVLLATVLVIGAGGMALAGTAGAATVSVDQLNGSGTVEDPYVITNATELQAIQQDLDANYTLGADIDASNTGTWNGGNGFDPIGEGDDPFTGTFDGRNHEIRGLTIDRPSEEYVGLFAVSDGTIGNVHLREITYTSETTAGGLVGQNEGEIRSVSVTGDVYGNEDIIGGLVGENRGDVIASNTSMDVRGTRRVGGLIGRNTGSVRASHTNSTVDGVRSTGGIAGMNSDTITSSHAHGYVNTSQSAGGLVGIHGGTIRGSFSTVDVNAKTNAGGIAGVNDGIIIDAYWDLEASGEANATGNGKSAGTGLRTAQITGEAAKSNTGLDFETTWVTTDGYPVLKDGVGNETILEVVPDEPTVTVNRSLLSTPEPDDSGGGGPGLLFVLGGVVGLLGLVGGGGFVYYRYQTEYDR